MPDVLRYDIDSAVGYRLGHASARLKIGLRRTFEAAGHHVTPEQWVVLYRLYVRPGQTQCELGDCTVKDKTTITRILDRLEQKALVTRRRDGRDRRSHRIFLTPAGDAAVRTLVPLALTYADAVFADLTPADREELARILGRIEARLDALLETKDNS